MSITVLRQCPSYSTLTSFDNFDSYAFDEFSIQQEIRSKQYEETRRAINNFREKYLVPGQSCRLEEIGKILTERGNSHVIEHLVTSISDYLQVSIDGLEFKLDKPIFPKRKHTFLTINIPTICLREHVEAEYTPESFANFLEAVKQWIPEYLSIEEKVVAQEKQRLMACTLAFDLMKRTIEPILERKGYYCSMLGPSYANKASIRINSDEKISLDLTVDLLEDFLEQLVNLVESLPQLPSKLEKKLPF